MGAQYLIIGITGVTCGGKTTLSKKLIEQINHNGIHSKFKINVRVISQDDYFHDVEDKRHVWVEELQHIHFDIITSLDMDKMYKDILNIVSNKRGAGEEAPSENTQQSQAESNKSDNDNPELVSFLQSLRNDVNILILEGFSIYEHDEIYKLCDLKYFFTLGYEECKRRRLLRVYEPPDCDGYFDVCVWPEYLKYLQLVQAKVKQTDNGEVTFFDSNDLDRSAQVFKDIFKLMCN